MRQLFFLPLIVTISCVCFGQSIEGTVYGNTSTIEGVIIKNLRTKDITTSSKEGIFIIKGKPQDSLRFQFFSFEEKTVVLNEKDTINFVVELIPKINQLGEVFIQEESTFKEEKFVEDVKYDIAKHIELYPEQYEYNNNPNGNLNFVNIAKRLWKKINKNQSSKPRPKIAITLEQYLSLFREDQLINDHFIVETLKIPTIKKTLFIDFCLAQEIDSKLLEEKNKFLLMDKLIDIGKEFLELENGN